MEVRVYQEISVKSLTTRLINKAGKYRGYHLLKDKFPHPKLQRREAPTKVQGVCVMSLHRSVPKASN